MAKFRIISQFIDLFEWHSRRLKLGFIFFILVASFQNCSPNKMTYAAADQASTSDPNGAGSSNGQTDADAGGPGSTFADTLQRLKPTLAIRGATCTMCHAQVQSGVITDFGYGNNFFLGNHTTFNNPYDLVVQGVESPGDNPWSTASISGGITIPRVANASDGKSLKQLLTEKFTQNNPPTVTEINSVYIAAPTDSMIRQKSGLSASRRMIYLPEAGHSVGSLSGLSSRGGNGDVYFTNSGVINCEGDLAIDGVVHLVGAQINTKNGCRIYSTKSIFVEGPLSLLGTSENRNIQLISSRSVNFGLGRCGTTDFVKDRVQFGWNENLPQGVGYATRSASTSGGSGGANILADADVLLGLPDATCSTYGSDVSYSRILVNAPHVHSRYAGTFTGTIIAEVAILKLAAMNFKFDSVFERVKAIALTGVTNSLSVK